MKKTVRFILLAMFIFGLLAIVIYQARLNSSVVNFQPGDYGFQPGDFGHYGSSYEATDSGVVTGSQRDPEKSFSEVEIFFATDRKKTENVAPDQRFGPQRNREGDHLAYGKATVTIPLNHKPGTVERPKWWKLEFKEDQEKHVVLLEPELMDEDSFYSSMRQSSNSRPSNELLMFVHGFNVKWGDAMRRTGQISHDLGFGGVTFCYSWPSQGNVAKYSIDRQNAEWASANLAKILSDISDKARFGKVHIVAHSMGTYVLTNALQKAKESGGDVNFDNIILAAPDIDRDIFTNWLPLVSGNIKRLTMYASSDDAALKISQQFNGSPRVGMSGADLFVKSDEMDTINASGIDTSFLGHSYYGSHKIVLDDIGSTIILGLLPATRSLNPGPLGEWNLPTIEQFEEKHLKKQTGRDVAFYVLHPDGKITELYSGDFFPANISGETVSCEFIELNQDQVLIVMGDTTDFIDLNSNQSDNIFRVRKQKVEQ